MQSKQEKKEKYIIIEVVLKWGFFSYMGQKWGMDPLFYGNGVGKWGLKRTRPLP